MMEIERREREHNVNKKGEREEIGRERERKI